MPSNLIISITKDEDSLFFDSAEKYGGVFFGLKWRQIYQEKIEVYGIYKNSELCGGFLLYRSRKFSFMILSTPPFMPYFGPWIMHKYSDPLRQRNFQRSIYNEIVKFLEKQRGKIKTLVLNPTVRDVLPFFWGKYKISPQLTYQINLSLPIENIRENFSGDKKNLIRKSEKNNHKSVITHDYKYLEELTQSYLNQKRIRVNPAYLHNIFSGFADQNNSFGILVKHQEDILSFGFFVHDVKTCYYLFGGNLTKGDNSAGTFVLWEAIQFSKGKKLQWFDFEGSVIPGIERYFSGFGGNPIDYYRINKAPFFVEILLKFFKRNLF